MGEAITPRPPLSRRLLPRLLLVTVSLALSLLIGELAVRLLRPQEAMTITPRGLYVPDPPRRYRLRPGYVGTMTNHVEFAHRVAINGYGMRGREAAGRREPGVLRVLVLGDSFTFGVGAAEDETYPARLEAHLREAGVRATVANAGAPGYGVPDEVAWYERWGPEVAPDVVVIAPFLANDLQDAAPATSVRVVGGELVAGDQRGGARRWLYYHSHLFRLLKSSLLEGALRGRLGLAEPWARRQQRAELALYAPAPPAELGAAIAATDAAIARFAKLTTERHERAVAVLVPSLPQVDPR
ncbi:MAG TPA: GDSL-type esterase/lipase family protein, partial [Thermoanaerobaculia bacterium]|nr:GDSL-type esterase/lipase family protein [Thermoanaerobaculia bacterium]